MESSASGISGKRISTTRREGCLGKKVRDYEGVIASTGGACAPPEMRDPAHGSNTSKAYRTPSPSRSSFDLLSAMPPNLVLAQFGCGYWGPNLLRNFSALPGCTVKYVVDSSAERRGFVESNFPLSRAIETHQTVLDDPSVDGVVIATPAASHFSLANQVLDAGKHVFVEKPLATKVAEVDELSKRAAERNLVVMTGHTFIYNAAVRYVKQLIDAGELGEIGRASCRERV